MIAGPDRVQIWASQLAANDFPPVCAMTGQPAEMWRKFTFRTPPTWVYSLLVLLFLGLLGIVIYAVVVSAVSETAAGYLPLTRVARTRLLTVTWTIVALLPATFLFLIAGAALGAGTDAGTSAVGAVLILLGVVAFVAFIVGALTRGRWGPRGKVTPPQPGYLDKVVELSNVHPSFVQAVQQVHVARLAQYRTST